MEPLIYQLPTSEKNIKLNPKITTDHNASPKLVKYGFNKMTDSFDLINLTKDNRYRIGLNFDFDRSDKDSIIHQGKKIFGSSFNEDFCIFWEILSLFSMLHIKHVILTNRDTIINHIITAYNKISNKKVASKAYEILPPKEKPTLIIKKYSDIELNEDAIVQLILTDLQKTNLGSNMILQIFSSQTIIMTELIYFLSTLYDEAYIVKPTISSILSDEKYIVLIGLKKDAKLFDIPKMKQNVYISSINISLPEDYTTTIQCINSELIPKKYLSYYNTKSYLISGSYEGTVYQEMLQQQNLYITNWLTIYKNGKSDAVLDSALKKSNIECASLVANAWK